MTLKNKKIIKLYTLFYVLKILCSELNVLIKKYNHFKRIHWQAVATEHKTFMQTPHGFCSLHITFSALYEAEKLQHYDRMMLKLKRELTIVKHLNLSPLKQLIDRKVMNLSP